MSGIGIRQKAMLDKMHYYGNGIYPPTWRMTFEQRKILESLRQMRAVVLVTHNGEDEVYRISHSWESTRVWQQS